MRKENELRPPTILFVTYWVLFVFTFLFFLIAFVSIFYENLLNALNVTLKQSTIATIVSLVFCFVELLAEFYFYRIKIIATENSLKVRFAFKKSINICYSNISKCIINTALRHASIKFYDVNNKKIVEMNNSDFVDFINIIESKNVRIERIRQ